jgi:hypothetical protein
MAALEGIHMFDPYCTTCSRRTLVGFRRLRSLDNTAEGIVLRFTCFCGDEAVLITGRHATAPVGHDDAAGAGDRKSAPQHAA